MVPITETLTPAEQNILKIYCSTRYIKNFLKAYDDEVIKTATNSYHLDIGTKNLYFKIKNLIDEKQKILNLYNIIEEALKDLRLDDFLLLEWQYIKLLNMSEIIKRLGTSERSYYRMLKNARASFFCRVKFYDTAGLVQNYNKHITNKNFLRIVETYRGNGESINTNIKVIWKHKRY